MIRQMIEFGDVIGRDADGNFFILVTIPQRSFTWLCQFGERFADLEDDNEDHGEEEAHLGAPLALARRRTPRKATMSKRTILRS